jgi:hypothetical protein
MVLLYNIFTQFEFSHVGYDFQTSIMIQSLSYHLEKIVILSDK